MTTIFHILSTSRQLCQPLNSAWVLRGDIIPVVKKTESSVIPKMSKDRSYHRAYGQSEASFHATPIFSITDFTFQTPRYQFEVIVFIKISSYDVQRVRRALNQINALHLQETLNAFWLSFKLWLLWFEQRCFTTVQQFEAFKPIPVLNPEEFFNSYCRLLFSASRRNISIPSILSLLNISCISFTNNCIPQDKIFYTLFLSAINEAPSYGLNDVPLSIGIRIYSSREEAQFLFFQW